MNPQKRADRLDDRLRQELSAFELSVLVAPDRSAPALPAFVGLLRAIGLLTRFAVGLALDGDRGDPVGLEPRILRA